MILCVTSIAFIRCCLPMKRFLSVCLLTLASASHASIVTTIKPLTLIASAVTEGVEQPEQLLPAGVSAHHYSLKPSERIRLQQAELVIWVGPNHETFLRALLHNRRHTLSLDNLPQGQRLPWRNLDTLQAQPHTVDSHLWLSPHNAILLAYRIAELRGQQKPQYAAKYQENAAVFAKNLNQTVAEQHLRFAALPQRSYLAYHDAYQYLETALGLHYRGSVHISPEQKAGVKHILALQKQVQQQGLRCLLTEPQFDDKLARQVLGAQGRYAMVDETFGKAQSYEEGFRQMADAIYGCLK